MNQRQSGHRWERLLAKWLTNKFGIPFLTSRAESRSADAKGLDFVPEDHSFPIDFQAKEQTLPSSSKSYSIKVEALDGMITNKKRALLVRLWRKGKQKRKLHGHYMVVDLEFGLDLLKNYYDNGTAKSTSLDEDNLSKNQQSIL